MTGKNWKSPRDEIVQRGRLTNRNCPVRLRRPRSQRLEPTWVPALDWCAIQEMLCDVRITLNGQGPKDETEALLCGTRPRPVKFLNCRSKVNKLQQTVQ